MGPEKPAAADETRAGGRMNAQPINPQTLPFSTPVIRPTFGNSIRALAADIKLSHSVFALPWAVLATFMAAKGHPAIGQLALILICMVLARTCAMAANRLLDARLDAINPRTARRAIPAGRLSKGFVACAIALCAAGFIAAAAGFGVFYHNWIPLYACVPVLAFLTAYPLLKRFSELCHYYLGAALALAPACAWIAIAGRLAIPPLLMGAAVLLWTAGFDILYACQDVDSDRATGVHSVPARLGIARALWVARLSHVACVGVLVALGFISLQLGTAYFVAVGAAGVLLIIEHSVVAADDLSRLNLAFFTLNGVVSIVIGTCGLIDVLRH